jgi:hypothetical protein
MGLEPSELLKFPLVPTLFPLLGTLKNPCLSTFLFYVPFVPMFLYINIEIGIYGVYI